MSKRKSSSFSSSDAKKSKLHTDVNDEVSKILDRVEELKAGSGAEETLRAEQFLELPSKKLYPVYYKEIAEPISLKEMRAKEYTALEDFLADVELMRKNAVLFNTESSDIARDASFIYQFVKGQIRQVLDAQEGAEAEAEFVAFLDRLKSDEAQIVHDLVNYKVKGRALSELFMEPVDKEQYPEYHKVIAKPTCFAQILAAIDAGEARTLQQFSDLVVLLFSNAKTFNAEESQVYQDAETLERIFYQKLERLTRQKYISETTAEYMEWANEQTRKQEIERTRQSNLQNPKIRISFKAESGAPATPGASAGEAGSRDYSPDVGTPGADSDADASYDTSAEQPVKRGRGRPKGSFKRYLPAQPPVDSYYDATQIAGRVPGGGSAPPGGPESGAGAPSAALGPEAVEELRRKNPGEETWRHDLDDVLITSVALNSIIPSVSRYQQQKNPQPPHLLDPLQYVFPASKTHAIESYCFTLPSYHSVLNLTALLDPSLNTRSYKLNVVHNQRQMSAQSSSTSSPFADNSKPIKNTFEVRLLQGINHIEVVCQASLPSENGRSLGARSHQNLALGEGAITDRVTLWIVLNK